MGLREILGKPGVNCVVKISLYFFYNLLHDKIIVAGKIVPVWKKPEAESLT